MEHDLTQKELQEASRRLQRECDHRVTLEREKVHLMEEERGRLLQQVETEAELPPRWSLPVVELIASAFRSQTERLATNSWRKSSSCTGSSRMCDQSSACSPKSTC